MAHRYFTADVFTDRPFGGNPLAVFPDAGELAGEAMQNIACELNLSETVFVLPPTDPEAVRRLRIFTPAEELPFAGHPTVGTAFVLATLGEIDLAGEVTEIVFEEGVGRVPVRIVARDGLPGFCRLTTAQAPEPFAVEIREPELVTTVGLEPEELAPASGAPPGCFSCGVPFLFVPLRDRAAVERARIDSVAWRRHLAGTPGANVFVFAPSETRGVDWRARMFAPTYGIEEDPATGSAVAAFAGWLARGAADGTHRWVVEQGIEMGRPSRLELEAEISGGQARVVHVGGHSVMMSEGRFHHP